MPRIANNADDYANARVGIFFTASGESPADGDLTGQCVTLVKWFLAEMTDVPSPFAARGDARYVGQTLVAQGYAVEVPFDQRQRGDIICMEEGTYGHIYVELSDNKVFEENVHWSGVPSRVVDGSTVYASRIGSENETWRFNRHAYRINSYNEGGTDMKVDANNLKYLYMGIYGQDPNVAVSPNDPQIGQDYSTSTEQILDYANKNGIAYWQYKPKAEGQIADLTAQVASLKQQLANGGGGFTAADRNTLNWIQKAIASIFKISV
jgi:hypothetical protein